MKTCIGWAPNNFATRLRGYAEASGPGCPKPGQTFRVQEFAQALALEVMLTAIFGPHDQERVQALARTILAYFQAFTTLLVYFPPLRRLFGGLCPWRRFTQMATHVDQLRNGDNINEIFGKNFVLDELPECPRQASRH